jgi:hypothetical protein
MKQSRVFALGEGAEWLKRNEAKLTGKNDPVLQALEVYNIKPKRAVEIGCSNGWRLAIIEQRYDCEVEGIDPCYISTRGQSKVQVWAGTADKLSHHFSPNLADLLIYGWCLYLCDPEDYFEIAFEGDQVLQDGGFLIVHDFTPAAAHRVPYKHKPGLFSYHYDFANLWLSHPGYSLYGRTIQNETSVTILKKDLKNAFPEKK